VGVVTGEGAHAPGRVSHAGQLNFDDVSSIISQKLGAKWTGYFGAQIQHPDTIQES